MFFYSESPICTLFYKKFLLDIPLLKSSSLNDQTYAFS